VALACAVGPHGCSSCLCRILCLGRGCGWSQCEEECPHRLGSPRLALHTYARPAWACMLLLVVQAPSSWKRNGLAPIG